jgi:hypothetical protein
MIQKKTVIEPAVPERTREVDCGVVCDLCKKEFKHAAIDGSSIDWLGNRGYGDVHITTIEIATGYSWPEAYDRKFRAYHICPECFEKVLEPWIKAQGADSTLREVDW